ncbi:centromere protein L [Protopterus annectens]|uniref:centromere protein L n=1 Tax=Protopterus annectens TaxID=7888 RepID=UPI001CFA8A34|nr:centromere protein L [Protopterus annectens]
MDISENKSLSPGATGTRRGVQFTSGCSQVFGVASAKRHAAFHHTPSRRKVPGFSPLQENVDPEKIALLLRKRWTLYSLTPLYKFSHAALKAYSRQLSAYIAAEKQKGLAIAVGLDLGVAVVFSPLPGLRGTVQDPEAVLIQITSKSPFPTWRNEEKLVWSGWLCCTSGDTEFLENLMKDFTCLPLFLTNGTESLTALVGAWFQTTFDCSFSLLTVSSLNLAWMAAMWTGFDLDSGHTVTELHWSVPCSPSLEISLSVHPDDAKALWQSIQQNKEEVTEEEVTLFIESLQSHFYKHFKIHLSATKLIQVSTSVASIDCEGKLKLLHRDCISKVLSFLTELAINKILW